MSSEPANPKPKPGSREIPEVTMSARSEASLLEEREESSSEDETNNMALGAKNDLESELSSSESESEREIDYQPSKHANNALGAGHLDKLRTSCTNFCGIE